MEGDWKQAFGHDVANCLIGECSSVVFAEPLRSCSERAVLLLHQDCPAKMPATRNAEGSKESSNATFIFASGVNGLISAGCSSER